MFLITYDENYEYHIHYNESNIDICEKIRLWRHRYSNPKFLEYELHLVEIYLSTRLKDETFRGILNIEKSVNIHTSIDEVEVAFVSIKIKI